MKNNKIDATYDFIKRYIAEKDFPPTIREIGDAINVKSTSTVSYYLRKLEERNKIVKGSFKNRSIQLTETISERADYSDLIVMPCVTEVATGVPLRSKRFVSEKFVFSGSLFKGYDMFLMPVKDDAMKNSGIFQGDMVVVSRQNVARNGELIVALVNNTYVIARLYREFELFRLHQDNSLHSPIYAEKVVILGKVVGVIRNEIGE